MKKFFKILGIVIVSVLLVLYLAFLFILPNVVNLNEYKPMVQDIVKEQTNLTLNFDNPKITVTPLLSAGIMFDNLSIKLPNDSELLSADSFKGRISLPSLLFLTVKVSTAEIVNPSINVDIIDGKSFAAVDAYEEILNKKEENIEQAVETTQNPAFDVSKIKIMVPKVKITNYNAFVNDLKTGNYLKLKGDELLFAYRNGESIALKTNADLFINDKKNINANIDIDTIIPQQSKLDEEDDKAQRVEIPFVNPVSMYMAYDLKANVDSKIKIRTKDKRLVSNGHFNVDNFSIKLAGLELPESKLHLTTRGTKADIDTDLYITKEEKISVLGMLNYAKKPSTDIKITSTKIQLDDVLTLVKATLDSLHVKHELAPLKGAGSFVFDTYLKTDFKKLKSQGNITVNDCEVINTSTKQKLAKVNSIISLDNSILKFVDTSVEVADTLFTVAGTIDENSVADISINTEKLPVEKIFTMFLPAEINRAYAVNQGYVNFKANIKGELKNALGDLVLSVNNLSLTDKVNKINYLNDTLTAEFKSDFKAITGTIKNSDFRLLMNGANVNCPKLLLTLGEKDITIDPAQLKINNTTNVDFKGYVKNYAKNPDFNIEANGKLITKDLKQLLGKDFAPFIKEKGALPFSASVIGDSKVQVIKAELDADKDNYITPVDIKSLLDKDTVLKAVIDLKGDRLKIKDTGFFIKKTQADPKDETKTITVYEDVVSVDGTITKLNTSNPNINLLKVKMPSELGGVIYAFPKSNFKFSGNAVAFGDLVSPRVRGEFNIKDLSIPELMITMENANAKFESKDLDVDVKNLLANGSDYNVIINADLTPSENFVIKNLNVISKLTDADKLMKVSDAAMKYIPQGSSSASQSAAVSKGAVIPVVIKSGTLDMKQIKSGTVFLENLTGKCSMFNDVFYIKDLMTNAFKGKVKGDVSVNLISYDMIAKLKGNGLDVEKTLLDAAAMKDTLTGTMDFNADISLKGLTYEEQMKSLKGKVDFTMKNGELGPFGKLENLILAENIRESAFFQTAIGSVLNSLLSFDTAKYNELKGNLTFKDGVTEINPITTEGDIMATYLFGNFNLLTNKIDIKLRGRLGSQVSDSMGPLAMLNPVNLVKATPGMSYVLGKIFFLFTEVVTEQELNKIPDLTKNISDTTSTKFQVIIRGNVEKPLTLVKSFKWLALESDMEKAKEYVNTLPTDTVPDLKSFGFTSTDPEVIKQEVKEKAKEQVKNQVKNKVDKALDDNLTTEQKENVNKAVTKLQEKSNEINALTEGKSKEEAREIVKEEVKKSIKNRLQNTLQNLATPPASTTNTIEQTTVEETQSTEAAE